MDAESANSLSPALISDAPRETTPDTVWHCDKASPPAAEEAASVAWYTSPGESVSQIEGGFAATEPAESELCWDSQSTDSSCSTPSSVSSMDSGGLTPPEMISAQWSQSQVDFATETAASGAWDTTLDTPDTPETQIEWDFAATLVPETSSDSETCWGSSSSASERPEDPDVVNSFSLWPGPSATLPLGSSGVAPLAMNMEPDQRLVSGDEECVVTPSALGPLSERDVWQKPSTSGGRGYIRTAKRFVARGLPAVMVVTLALNVLLTLRNNQAHQQHGSLADDSSKPASSVQCGRSIEEYMLEIDMACCGDVLDDHPDSRCSVGSWIAGKGKRTQVWRENNLYVCTDSCAERVLPLWSQCIQPELLDKYGASEASPAWLFKPVVAKCSQPAKRRTTCEDDDSVVDPLLHTLTELNATMRLKGEMPHEPRSLCAELRAGQLECADLLTPDGLRSADYPAGWYDDTCCKSCPVYWPRAVLPDLDLSSRSGAHSSIWHDMLNSKSSFQAVVEALEEQEQASASVTDSFAAR